MKLQDGKYQVTGGTVTNEDVDQLVTFINGNWPAVKGMFSNLLSDHIDYEALLKSVLTIDFTPLLEIVVTSSDGSASEQVTDPEVLKLIADQHAAGTLLKSKHLDGNKGKRQYCAYISSLLWYL